MAKKKAKKKAKTKTKSKAKGKKASSREVLVVGSKVKAYVKKRGAKSSGELVSALSEELYSLIDRAIERADGNKRSTVQPKDL